MDTINKRPDILHLSCHGSFNLEKPSESHIALSDVNLSVNEIFNHRIDSNLVTVSACETGINDAKPGDELEGLTRTLLYAEASSVIVSLLVVNAGSTIELMDNFYRHIKNKENDTNIAISLQST